MTDAVHEVYAVKFGSNSHGTRGRYFLHDAGLPADEHVPLDYFIWAIRSPQTDIVVDAGWTAATNRGRPRTLLENPGVSLRRVGVDAARVQIVVLSHFHNDHVGDLDAFPAAMFVAQRAEFDFWTSEASWTHASARHAERDDVAQLVALHDAGRLRLLEGDAEIADGVRVQLLGGHTPGSQIVIVDTRRGTVVLAGDAAHYFEEVERGHEFVESTDATGLRRGIDRIRQLASTGVVVPGHDPAVLQRFERVPGHETVAVRVG